LHAAWTEFVPVLLVVTMTRRGERLSRGEWPAAQGGADGSLDHKCCVAVVAWRRHRKSAILSVRMERGADVPSF